MGPGGPIGPGGPVSGEPSAPQTQPLPSNVLGKGGDRSLDQQYMQQSSQIFVFSTEWANRSAHSVMENQCPSIIAWHESQQETKKQLEVRKVSSNINFILKQLFFNTTAQIREICLAHW